MPSEEVLRSAHEAYGRGENVMRVLRERDAADRNGDDAVLLAYDLQSGTYREWLEDPGNRVVADAYSADLAAVLAGLDFGSLLDVGTGEATTLMPILEALGPREGPVAAFDLAWSRIAHARAHARAFGVPPPELFTGSLFRIPVVDDAFELVCTSHALEPNGGREREALAELARVSRRWIALFEPSDELGGPATRAHVAEHGYVRGLRAAAEALGLEVVRHELLARSQSPANETATLILRVPEPAGPAPERWPACPRCRAPLEDVRGHRFCAAEGLVYPVLDGIPCLDERVAVVASHFGGGV